jgi:hypothetical protein
MNWVDDHQRIEKAADFAAAAFFAGAVGFAVSVLTAEAGLVTLLLVAVVFRVAYAGLRQIPTRAAETLPIFDVPTIEQPGAKDKPSALPKLRLVGSTEKTGGGERNRSSGIPLHSSGSRTAPDASQALSDALAQIRQSLR